MKKQLVITIIITVFCLLFTSCSENSSNYLTYELNEVLLDGEDIALPQGTLVLKGNNMATISIEGHSAELIFDNGKATINDLVADVEADSTRIVLKFPEIGLVYVFSNVSQTHSSEISEADILGQLDGRLYFAETFDDSFEDYSGVSLSVNGYLTDSKIVLFCKDYSDSVPIAELDMNGEGLIMDYEVKALIKDFEGTAGDLIEQYDIADPFKYRPWDAPSGYYDQIESSEEKTDMMEIKATCGNAFNCDILLIKKTS